MKMALISIPDEFSKEDRMTRDGGERLRHLILERARQHELIELDFKKIPIASVSFWDEGVAKLLVEGWTQDELRERLRLVNAHPRDLEILERLISSRKKDLRPI